MRGFLIFLAVASPIVLMSPSFWALVGMEWSATPVTYHYHDGTSQQALLGPKAPWPEWALKPDGATLRVRSWFGPSSNASAIGQADLSFDAPTAQVVPEFIAKLEAAGWEVEAGLFRARLPEIPPRLLETCRIRARLSGRELHASLDYAPVAGLGTLSWSDGPSPPGWRHPASQQDGRC